MVDILAGAGAGYTDPDRGIDSVDGRIVRACDHGRSRVDRDGHDIRPTGSVIAAVTDRRAAPAACDYTKHADQGSNQICSHSLRPPYLMSSTEKLGGSSDGT